MRFAFAVFPLALASLAFADVAPYPRDFCCCLPSAILLVGLARAVFYAARKQ